MADVRLVGLTKFFGKVRAIEDINLHVRDGEFMTLLGPSGCGKTTTLRCIAGLEVPTRGEIYIGGQLVNDLPPKDRNVAMVFQNWALYPHMTVYNNIAFPLKIRRYPREEIRKKVLEVARMLKIEDLLDRKPSELSGGQQQRVALGRALVREPSVFLLDEPLSNLDAKLRVYMRAELKALQRRLGVTTIYVTHDQVEAMTMSDRIAIMNEGRIQQVGRPEEVYEKPANVFVAGFIGSPPMNFIEGSLVEDEGRLLLDTSYFRLDLSHLAEVVKEKATGSELVLGVRPEHIKLLKEPIEDAVEASVYVLEPLGREVIVDLKVGDLVFKVREEAGFRAEPGERLWMVFDKEKIHLFDKRTGKAVV